MIFKDYYKILGLDSNKVDTNDIKIAYREQAKKYHPDVNVGNKNTEERFKDINEAYKILSDPSTRKKYDRNWNAKIGRKRAKNQKETQTKRQTRKEFLNMILGLQTATTNNQESKSSDKNVKVQGENVETQISISIVEGFFGLNKTIQLRTVKGNMKTFNVAIPAGIRDGERIKLIGQGKPGKNGGKNGDLIIRINLTPDKKFKLIGQDIYTDLKITPWEAVLGTKIDVDAIDETIGVFIPQCSVSGEQIKIQNKGYRDVNGSRGNFIINLQITTPKTISEKEKDYYKQLKKVSKFNPREE